MTWRYALKLLAIGGFLAALLYTCQSLVLPYDSTDGEGQRSGMSLHTDALTGCQYLSRLLGGLTPRLDRSGQQVCQDAP